MSERKFQRSLPPPHKPATCLGGHYEDLGDFIDELHPGGAVIYDLEKMSITDEKREQYKETHANRGGEDLCWGGEHLCSGGQSEYKANCYMLNDETSTSPDSPCTQDVHTGTQSEPHSGISCCNMEKCWGGDNLNERSQQSCEECS